MRPRKIFALLDGPKEDTLIGICFGVCKLLNHIDIAYKPYTNQGISSVGYIYLLWPANLPHVNEIRPLLQHHLKITLL